MPACSDDSGDNLLMPKYLDDTTRVYRGHGAAKKLHCMKPSCLSSPCQKSEECTETKSGFVCGTHGAVHTTSSIEQDNRNKVRIIGGRSTQEGRVEIRHDNVWLPVSKRYWDIYSAAVVCRFLGFLDAVTAHIKDVTDAAPGTKGSSPPYTMVRLSCEGDEIDLTECKTILVESYEQRTATIMCDERSPTKRCENGGSFIGRHPTSYNVSKPCACMPGFTGPLCEWATSCKVLFDAGYNRTDIYTIKPGKGNAFPVKCDMDTDGGGWTVIMRSSQSDSIYDFNPSLRDYQDGFLDPSGDHWIGLDRMLALGPFPVRLRIDIRFWQIKVPIYGSYDFFLAGADQKYRADFKSFNGTAGDPLIERPRCSQSGRQFRMLRVIRGNWSPSQGWWHAEIGCNVMYSLTNCMSERCAGIRSAWLTSKGYRASVKEGEMKIRRKASL
ncbi:uncharacterized protein LOC121425996 [Lytechinus variegatus]|uniref:uncharacterized protein LOC121425996 n=1 Tax=Lytechinus variegatus TaxID=7654 RepID=UPI001BB27028|nr:uncharacterized protein LOC121425996 [Lytechinus variegatus]